MQNELLTVQRSHHRQRAERHRIKRLRGARGRLRGSAMRRGGRSSRGVLAPRTLLREIRGRGPIYNSKCNKSLIDTGVRILNDQAGVGFLRASRPRGGCE